MDQKNFTKEKSKPSIIIKDYNDYLENSKEFYQQFTLTDKFEEELAREAKLYNDNKETDIKLKIKTLNFLLGFLIGETFLIFLMSFLQGFRFLGFNLEEWNFRILTASTITQIYLMLRIAVEYLFPKNKLQ